MPELFLSESEAETIALAREFAGRLEPGAVVLLVGELGSGKTVFVRGMALGLGIAPDEVSSPTFTLIQEYRGRLPFYHVDLYRLTAAETEDLGLDELTAGNGIVAIEWADRLARPPAAAIRVRLSDAGDDRREIDITKTP